MDSTREIEKAISEYIRKNHSAKRQIHIEGVRTISLLLAKRYGVDPKKAELAALFHDMYRGTPEERMNEYVKAFGLEDKYLNNPNLSHSKVAAVSMRQDFGVDDQDIINAVAYHTTGRAGMSTLEKIIYLADAIEPSRVYPNVDKLRKIACKNLDEACLAAVQNTIEAVRASGVPLDQETLQAEKDLEYRIKQAKENEKEEKR